MNQSASTRCGCSIVCSMGYGTALSSIWSNSPLTYLKDTGGLNPSTALVGSTGSANSLTSSIFNAYPVSLPSKYSKNRSSLAIPDLSPYFCHSTLGGNSIISEKVKNPTILFTGEEAYIITESTAPGSLNTDFRNSYRFSPESILSANSGLIDSKTFINPTHVLYVLIITLFNFRDGLQIPG